MKNKGSGWYTIVVAMDTLKSHADSRHFVLANVDGDNLAEVVRKTHNSGMQIRGTFLQPTLVDDRRKETYTKSIIDAVINSNKMPIEEVEASIMRNQMPANLLPV